MSTRTLLFTDCVDFVGSACKPFAGMKKYVSTGAVDVDHINDSDTEIVDYDGKPSRANLEVMAGDVLFAKMQGTKKTLLIDPVLAKHIYSTGFCAVRAKKAILTERCLYHILTSEMFLSQKDKNCSGATQKAITNAGLGKIVIRVPSIEMQNDIADQLDAVISIIAKRQQELSTLDELIKARFVEMFGDPVTNPKGWQVIPWESVFDTKTGKLDSNAAVESGEYPFFTCAKDWLWIDKYAYDCEALLLAGNNAAGVYDVKHYKGKFNAYQRTYILQLKDADWSYSLFKYQLEDRLQYLQSQSKGTNTRYLTMGILNSLAFIAPPKELQDEFTTLVAQVDKSKVVVQKALDEAQLLFDSLMQKYFG